MSHLLDCGCELADNRETMLVYCKLHTKASVHKICKAHGEIIKTERCSNCGYDRKPVGYTCFQCGVSDRIGSS